MLGLVPQPNYAQKGLIGITIFNDMDSMTTSNSSTFLNASQFDSLSRVDESVNVQSLIHRPLDADESSDCTRNNQSFEAGPEMESDNANNRSLSSPLDVEALVDSLDSRPDLKLRVMPEKSTDKLTNSGVQQLNQLRLIRTIGYVLVLFALVDGLYALVPPQFTDPVWEFQTIGDLFERVPVLMLGLILSFYGDRDFRRGVERQALCVLSWMSLLIGIGFFLLIPLCANDAVQINRLNNQQINAQISEQDTQFIQARDRLNQASQDQLNTLLLPPEEAKKVPNAPRTGQAAKEVALENLEKAQDNAVVQANKARKNLKQNLLKNTARLIFGSVISGGILVYLWALTNWARDLKGYRNAAVFPGRKAGGSLSPKVKPRGKMKGFSLK